MSEETETKDKKLKEPEFVVMRDGKLLLKASGWKKTHEGLTNAEQQEETIVGLQYDFTGYPLDAYVAINRALDEIFGYTEALREGFWGERPPTRISVKTGLKTEMQVYAGKLAPPAWEGGYIQMIVKSDNPMSLLLYGQLKRKFEPSINKVVDRAKELIQTESIYRGRAVELDLSYTLLMRAGVVQFDPVKHAPKFIDVSKPPLLILPRDVQNRIDMHIWAPIRNPDDFRVNRIAVKGGSVLSGPPGTGKTLTALHTGTIAVQSGWSYFKLLTPDFFVQAYELAQFYAPSVLVVEDVEKIFGGPRTPEMDMILDRLDGIASKGSEVFTMCTTNYPEQINQAVRRSGRIGHHIQFRAMDGEAAGRFINTIAGDFLHPDVDLEQVGPSFDGLVASDVTEGVSHAKKIAIAACGREIKKKVTAQMLIDGGEIVRRDKGLYAGPKITQSELNLRIVQAAFHVQMGREIPVELWQAAAEYARTGENQPGKEKPAKGQEVEALTEGSEE